MKVAIITEGFQGTGYGHLTRCLSIYQAFEEKNIIPLYIANCDENGKIFVPDVNLLQLNWLEKEDELVKQIEGFDFAIIDSYLAPLELYEVIHNSVKKTVYIDDYIRLNYPPGIIINGTIGAENLPYKKDSGHQYLLGLEFMPLRREFWDVEINTQKNNVVLNILITFGGQDFRQLTNQIVGQLYNKFPNITFHVVLPSNVEKKYFADNVKYYKSLSAKEILGIMSLSNLAISAGGQTTYELARIGIKTFAVGVIENQKYNMSGWKKIGYIEKEHFYDDKELLEEICRFVEKNIKTCDSVFYNGQGARNIIENLERLLQ